MSQTLTNMLIKITFLFLVHWCPVILWKEMSHCTSRHKNVLKSLMLHYLYCNIAGPPRSGVTFDDHKRKSPEEQRKAQEQEHNEVDPKMRNKVYTAASIGTVTFIVCVGLTLFILYKQLPRIRRSPSQTSKDKEMISGKLMNLFLFFVNCLPLTTCISSIGSHH